jgi:ADP-ribosylation factor-like protein 1
VIDSTDVERLNTAADELSAMLNEEELREAALLVFANKQDQPGAKGAGEISEALKLGELRDRNWSIVACSAIDGKGLNEGMDWLVVRLSTLPMKSGSANVGMCSKLFNPKTHKRWRLLSCDRIF